MSVDVSTPASGARPPSVAPREAVAEPRSFDAKATTRSEAANNPSMSLRLPNGKRMIAVVDRVRARPAITPTLSMNLGVNAIGLGIWGALFPGHVKKTLGIRAPKPVIQAVFGARELWSGYSLAGDPTKSEVLWARVAADVFDIVALRALANRDNPKRGNAKAALGIVLAVTALDLIAAVRMSNVQRNCRQGA